MRQLVYTSRVTNPLSDLELQKMLVSFRAHNVIAGISGVLLHSWGNFLQFLEGEQAIVEKLFLNIKRDLRHTDIIIEDVTLPTQSFEDWSMGFVDLSKGAQGIDGFAGFPSDINLRLVDPGMVLDLVVQSRASLP
jgi:hypothetical protein